MAEVARKSKLEEERAAVVEEYNLKHGGYHCRVKPRQSIFDLRTEAMRTDDGKKKRKGRLFDTLQATKNGGIRVEEMIYGMKMAQMSCIDDRPIDERPPLGSLNSAASLEKAIGGDCPEEMVKLPLSQILKERYGLTLDCWINEQGVRKGRPIDTQAFIASNDETIVLSYRFTDSFFDWMSNFSMTSSEWEVKKDEALGHPGVFSSVRGYWTKYCRPWKKDKPRVHTAFYNCFIYTTPMIRKHIIEPLLKSIKSGKTDAKPKKIFVVGTSLGAAVSQLAYCFILDELFPYLSDPEFKIVDRLISVTAGSPRVGDNKFRDHVKGQLNTLRPLDRAVICRLVHNNDVVPHAPPNILRFCHIDKMVYITKYGEDVLVNPDISTRFTKFGEFKAIFLALRNKAKFDRLNCPAVAASKEQKDIDLEKEFEEMPEGSHDHSPYWYMTYLEKLKVEQDARYHLNERQTK